MKKNPVSLALEVLEERVVPAGLLTLSDTDGDVVTVKLTGDGALSGGLDGLTVADTDEAKSALSIIVKKGDGGDGFVDLESIMGSGLASISAATTSLTGEGIHLEGFLGKVTVKDLKNGADIIADGEAGQKSSVTAGVVGEGTQFTFGSQVTGIKLVKAEGLTITAASLGSLQVTGDKKAVVAGDFSGSITTVGTVGGITIAGDAGNENAESLVITSTGMGALKIGGDLTNAKLSIEGKAGAVKVTGDLTTANFTIGGEFGGVEAAIISGLTLQASGKSGAIVSKGSLDSSTITVAGALTGVTAGSVHDVTVAVTGALGKVAAKEWIGGSISADSLGSLSITGDKNLEIAGDFTPNLILKNAFGGSAKTVLGSAKVAGEVSGTWAVEGKSGAISVGTASDDFSVSVAGTLAGITSLGDFSGFVAAHNISKVLIGGDALGAQIMAGGDLGLDGELGSTEASGVDYFGAGVLKSVLVKGSSYLSLFSAGLDPMNGAVLDGIDVDRGGGKIGSFAVKGELPAGNHIVAETLPKTIAVGKFKFAPELEESLFNADQIRTEIIRYEEGDQVLGTLLSLDDNQYLTVVADRDDEGNITAIRRVLVVSNNDRSFFSFEFDAAGNFTQMLDSQGNTIGLIQDDGHTTMEVRNAQGTVILQATDTEGTNVFFELVNLLQSTARGENQSAARMSLFASDSADPQDTLLNRILGYATGTTSSFMEYVKDLRKIASETDTHWADAFQDGDFTMGDVFDETVSGAKKDAFKSLLKGIGMGIAKSVAKEIGLGVLPDGLADFIENIWNRYEYVETFTSCVGMAGGLISGVGVVTAVLNAQDCIGGVVDIVTDYLTSPDLANVDLVISYSWSTNVRDLDTATTFHGTTVGWSASESGPYLAWTGDDTSSGGRETVTIDLLGAWEADFFTGNAFGGYSIEVGTKAGWYSPAGGSGPATLSVYLLDTSTGAVVPGGKIAPKRIAPGTQSGVASTPVGSVTLDFAPFLVNLPGETRGSLELSYAA